MSFEDLFCRMFSTPALCPARAGGAGPGPPLASPPPLHAGPLPHAGRGRGTSDIFSPLNFTVDSIS